MLSTALSCVCDVTSDGAVDYVGWVARGFNLCVYTASWRDIVGAAALGAHILLWFFLYFPQLYRNWNLRSASNHSLLYVSFLLIAEISFLIASLLQRFAWGWQSLRIWRVLAACILLVQVIYYKSCARTDFQSAVEAPYAQRIRTANSDDEDDEDGHYLSHPIIGVYEAASPSHGWPKRKKPGNGDQQVQGGGSTVNHGHIGLKTTNLSASAAAAQNKSAQFGMPQSQWGQSLLSDTDGRSNSPSRSRLPSAQQHLLNQAAPRTISPSQPIRSIRGGGGDSSHSIASSPSAEALGTSIDNERRRVAALQQAHHNHGRSISGSQGAAPRPPSATTSPAGSFHSSPTSAFRPVSHHTAAEPAAGLGSGSGADFSAVTTTSSGYHILSSSSSGSTQEQGGSAVGGSSVTKLTTLGMSVVCITLLSFNGLGPATQQGSMMELSQPSAASQWAHQSQQHSQMMSNAGRSLLSTAAGAAASRSPPSFSDAVSAFPSLLSSAISASFAASDDSPSYCNNPYDPREIESYILRVFSWLGVCFFCLALFPQFIYNDSWIHSVQGISFWTYRAMILADALWIVGIVVPRHNDWIENRYYASLEAAGASSGDGSFMLDQVILPLTIAQGFHMLACLVLFVQRARFKRLQMRNQLR